MKCVKCGNELQPGARFCIYCGTPAATEPETEAAPNAETAVPPAPETPVEEISQQYQQPTYQQQPVQPAPKKKKTGLVAVLVTVFVLLVALAAAAVAIFFLFFYNKTTASSDRQLSYVKNGKLYYVKDVSKDSEPVVVSSVKNADEYVGSGLSGEFTADGSYLYFYSKVESSTSGKLCRVEVSKLKADEDKNEDLVEELVSGVSSYTLLDNDRFIYENDSSELYYYDGEEKNKIASGVGSYNLGEDDSVYFTILDVSDDWSTYQFGRYTIADDETTILIDNCSYIVEEVSDGWFYAVYDSEDYLYDLYYCTKDGDRELIASDTYNITGADAADNTVYYVTQRTENVCYYDLVNDTYADEDAGIAQPVAKDYLTKCTEYDAMSDWDREYYANYPEDIDYFYDWLYEDDYFDTGLLYYYSYHVDEAGNYIYGYYFYDEAAAQWYALDENAYSEAYNAYYAVADRISLREELQEETTDITYYDLSAWTPGSGQSAVASGISPYTATLVGETGIVTYQKYGELGKVDWPEDSYGTWFVSDYIEDCLYNNDGAYFYNYNGTENEWNDEWGNLSGGISFDVSSDGRYVMGFVYTLDDDDDYAISMNAYEVKDGTISLLESGISASGWGIWQEDGYYYFEQDSEDDGNLCCYVNGKSTTVLKNISYAGVNRYDNGSYTAFTDGDTLKLFSADGDSTKVASGVSSYCYIDDGLIVYLSDEKLYVYRGEDEDKTKIDGSVTSFNCNGAGYDILLY